MSPYKKILIFLSLSLCIIATGFAGEDGSKMATMLTKNDVAKMPYHLEHYKIFSKYTSGYNLNVLRAIDTVQSHAMDGGTYFLGIKAVPPESPVNYELKLGDKSLITPPRSSSYCSGSTYAAFIESLNYAMPEAAQKLTAEQIEAMRMQEPDGGRREDWIKFWGIWNADGFGSQFALVQYANIAVEVKPEDAQPGDFANISWKSGNGHSVIILGWYVDENNEKNLVFWSSQKSTNGYGDKMSKLDDIAEIKIVRIVSPEKIYNFDIKTPIDKSVKGDIINWK